MENGVQALKIGASILIFVLAITITISVFTSATQALNRIFSAEEAQEYVKDEAGNYLNFVSFDGGTREVKIDTIIPSIYRAYKENYAVYFYQSDGTDLVLYQKENGEKVNYIDLEQGRYKINETTNPADSITKLLEDSLYTTLKGKTFTEKLGEYYMEDVEGETETAEVNKTKKRVIAYIETSM